MNCKPGDLAVIVKARCFEHIGKVVQVVRAYPGDTRWYLDSGPAWLVEYKGEEYHCPDEFLRPIRPNDGEDEMIRIAGKPREQNVSLKETA